MNARQITKAHVASNIGGVESCCHCGYRFRHLDPDLKVQLCDRCFGDVMRYVTASKSTHQTHARLKAAHRLYARPAQPTDQLDPCEE